MPSLIRKEKITCENCGTQTTRNNIVGHKKSCPAGTLYCTHCPNFSTKSQSDLNYHIAKKHSAPKSDVTFKLTPVKRKENPDAEILRVRNADSRKFWSKKQSCQKNKNHSDFLSHTCDTDLGPPSLGCG